MGNYESFSFHFCVLYLSEVNKFSMKVVFNVTLNFFKKRYIK